MSIRELCWLLALLTVPCGLGWLAYEVRRLRQAIGKNIGVNFASTLSIKVDDK